jgi:hypothetical protein
MDFDSDMDIDLDFDQDGEGEDSDNDTDTEYSWDFDQDGFGVETPGADTDFVLSEDGSSASNNIGSTESSDNEEFNPYADSSDPESERGRFLGDSRHNDDEEDEEDEEEKKRRREKAGSSNCIFCEVLDGLKEIFGCNENEEPEYDDSEEISTQSSHSFF